MSESLGFSHHENDLESKLTYNEESMTRSLLNSDANNNHEFFLWTASKFG
jgi:hypothetical protein